MSNGLGPDFINVTKAPNFAAVVVPPTLGSDQVKLEFQDRTEGVIDIRRASRNAVILKAIFDHYRVAAEMIATGGASVGAVVYFPPGRYYIGRPWTDGRPAPGSRPGTFACDLLVPSNVQLKFSPGATLVLLDFATLSQPRLSDDSVSPSYNPLAWVWFIGADPVDSADSTPGESTKVRLEIQGTIDADAQCIFDVSLLDLEVPSFRTPSATILATGRVHLSSARLRLVFPEWWGAGLPADLINTAPPAVVVRRTTLALQECFDAAHRNRHLVRNVQAAIPIVLSSEYLIDEELMIGTRWYDAQRSTPFRSVLVAQPHNPENFVLRGARALAPEGRGHARIKASPFFTRSAAPTRLSINRDTGQGEERLSPLAQPELAFTDSLLGVRGVAGIVIENVEFDADYRASRCLTFETPGPGFNGQSSGVTSCSFRNAVRQLLHLGGEVFQIAAMSPAGGYPFDLVTSSGTEKHWSGSQDIAGTRFQRCFFKTMEGPPDIQRSDSKVIGVYFRADQSLNLEFQDCVFRGAAAPMFISYGGRFCLQNCYFHTEIYPDRPQFMDWLVTSDQIPDGLDIFLASPPFEALDNPPSASSCMLKNVYSRSQRLLANSLRQFHGQPGQPPVQLINVVHRPVVLPDTPLPAAIQWGAIGVQGPSLILVGCLFERQLRPRMGDFEAPVMVDRANFRMVASAVVNWRDQPNSRGHVIDLGNRVLIPGRIGPGLLVALSPEFARVATSLPMLERLDVQMFRV